MVDNILTNYAETIVNAKVEVCNSNTCLGNDLGAITKVEIRAFGYVSAAIRDVDLSTQYGPGGACGLTTSPGWGNYIDVTIHQPDWTWAKIQSLIVIARAVLPFMGTVYCSKIEVRVTYEIGGVAHEVELEETLTLSEDIATESTFNVALEETLNLSEDLKHDISIALEETLNLSEDVVTQSEFYVALVETLNLSEDITTQSEFYVSLAERLNLSEEISTKSEFYVALAETLDLSEDVIAELAVAIEKIRMRAVARKIGHPRPQNIGIGM